MRGALLSSSSSSLKEEGTLSPLLISGIVRPELGLGSAGPFWVELTRESSDTLVVGVTRLHAPFWYHI
jgi:hypothetical protein